MSGLTYLKKHPETYKIESFHPSSPQQDTSFFPWEKIDTFCSSSQPIPFPPQSSSPLQPKTQSLQIPQSHSALQAIQRHVCAASEADLDTLTRERRKLVLKKFEQGLSPEEEAKLRILDWEIDQLEDALYGKDLDLLEQIVQERVALGKQIQQLKQDLEKLNLSPRE